VPELFKVTKKVKWYLKKSRIKTYYKIRLMENLNQEMLNKKLLMSVQIGNNSNNRQLNF